jgi:ribulose-phosphate 3-epimerase
MIKKIVFLGGLAMASAFSPSAFSPSLRAPSARATCKQGATATSMVWGGKDYLIAPSILSADFAKLGQEVDNMIAAGADVVHFDVMDNHYVPNLTIGPGVCKALRDHGVTAPIDVHLMVDPVDRIIGDFVDAGASYITFHPEASNHIDRTLSMIREGGCKAGLVFTPATSLDYCKYVMDKIDIILLMSVNPGFGGQKFIPSTLAKAKEARKLIDESVSAHLYKRKHSTPPPITHTSESQTKNPKPKSLNGRATTSASRSTVA